jgi:hypothetical protein
VLYWPGEKGLVLLRYSGLATQMLYFPGPVTGVRYPFGGIRLEGYVDSRDAEKMQGGPFERC